MNVLPTLASSASVERLGWTLVHFLWQGLTIAAPYAAVRRAMARRRNAKARYLLACGALVAMMAAPLVTWGLMGPWDASPVPSYGQRNIPTAAWKTDIGTTPLPASVRTVVLDVQRERLLAWVVMAWLAGAVVFWARLAGGWVVAARMRSVRVRAAPVEWQETLRRLGARLGLARPVRLLVSALVEAPAVVGWLRPVVLVPVGALAGLPAEQVEALLLHELAHIRRHDYLVNLLQSAAEALLFYHPAVWWVSGHIRAERELCCDDEAVSVSGDALTYARALARLEAYRPAHLRTALAASGGSLSGRIARVLGQPRPAVRAGLGPGSAAVAILLAAAAFGVFGQSAAHPTFQSIAIQRNTSNWSERFEHPMGMSANASLMLLIRFAYASHDNPMAGHTLPLPASQVTGGPAWVHSERYDIEAKPPARSDPKQIWQMWQSLLADRFKLRLHRETRDLPVYVLTRARNGFRLPPPPKEVGCVSFPPGTTPRSVPGKVDCGYVSGPFSGNRSGLLDIQGSKVRMADLVRELAVVLDRPVLDRTGFTAEFDLNLSFAADQATSGLPGFGSAGAPNRPDIFTALEEQLGLKLAPGGGPVEVLVIDHAERPTAN